MFCPNIVPKLKTNMKEFYLFYFLFIHFATYNKYYRKNLFAKITNLQGSKSYKKIVQSKQLKFCNG